MKKIFPVIFLSVSAFASFAFSATPDIDVIYGEDNRLDVFESQDAMLVQASRSTAALIEAANLKATASGYVISGSTLKDRGACSKERFASQVSVAKCSGFLVAPHILVTAGHCAKSNVACPTGKWVFDYKRNAEAGPINISKGQVYNCKKILSRSLDPVTKMDFAVIELDRAVSHRAPLSFRKSGTASVGDSIAVIGHPVGLPTKIADNAQVRSVRDNFFVTNLDTYHGNSGSAVINTRSGIVEGILVRGDSDFVKERGCQVSKICSPEGCRGEDVTHMSVIDYLKRL